MEEKSFRMEAKRWRYIQEFVLALQHDALSGSDLPSYVLRARVVKLKKQVLKRVIGKIVALIIDEAKKVAEKHNLVLSDFDGTKLKWCEWYLATVESGEITDALIRLECRKYKVKQ